MAARGALHPVLWLALTTALPLHAQFAMQDSTTTADLRGVVSVGNGTAWASGTHGTVLRTEDGGFLWQGCTTPPGAEKLDFRGIQAFDDQTAIVMSSGKGDLSRVYKTTDGCKTWKLVFTNPDADGFFDAILVDWSSGGNRVHVLGDSVADRLVVWSGSDDSGFDWLRNREFSDAGAPPNEKASRNGKALPNEGSFAASNSVLVRSQCSSPCHPERSEGSAAGSRKTQEQERHIWFASQVPGHSLVHRIAFKKAGAGEPGRSTFSTSSTPMAQDTTTAGIFSLAFRDEQHGVAVGGDYGKPAETGRTAATTRDSGATWQLATHSPHGYRSSVAYDSKSKTWITVGPNGTDVSTDDGRNWRPLLPGKLDDANADKQWNALSLPYVVGPHGRIGRLRDDALQPHR